MMRPPSCSDPMALSDGLDSCYRFLNRLLDCYGLAGRSGLSNGLRRLGFWDYDYAGNCATYDSKSNRICKWHQCVRCRCKMFSLIYMRSINTNGGINLTDMAWVHRNGAWNGWVSVSVMKMNLKIGTQTQPCSSCSHNLVESVFADYGFNFR